MNPAAKAAIAQLADQTGMKEINISSRVYEWFASQPDVVRKAVLGLLPEGLEIDIARMVLQRIANGDDGDAPPIIGSGGTSPRPPGGKKKGK